MGQNEYFLSLFQALCLVRPRLYLEQVRRLGAEAADNLRCVVADAEYGRPDFRMIGTHMF